MLKRKYKFITQEITKIFLHENERTLVVSYFHPSFEYPIFQEFFKAIKLLDFLQSILSWRHDLKHFLTFKSLIVNWKTILIFMDINKDL